MLRPGVGIVNQIGIETTPGTAVPVNKFLSTLNFNLKPTVGAKTFRAQGSRVNTSSVQHKRMASGDFDGILDYNSFPYVCEGLFNAATPTALVASIAFQRIYTAGVRTADATRKTFTIEQGDATAVDKFAFAQLLSMAI